MDRGIGQDGTGGARPVIPERPSPADYIFLLRPMILIPVWTFFLLGAWHGSRSTGATPNGPSLLAGILTFTAIVAAAYIINQITDRETDRASGKLFLLSHGVISVRAAWTEAAFLAVSAVAASVLLLPRGFTAIILIGAWLGAAYSIEPYRLKKRAVLDVLANAVANGVLNTLAGWIAVGAPLDGLAILAPYPLAVAAVHLSTTLADIEGDSKSGLRTSGVVLGRRKGIIISTALMACSFAAAVLTRNTPALYASGVSLLIFIIVSISERNRSSGQGILLPAKISTLSYSLAACVLFPAYIPLLAVTMILTRVYYAKRFGMRYPSL
jgi:4-hydroxybenzoate polyprenyltransferase